MEAPQQQQAPIEMALHLGFRFEPTPNQVITYYLQRLIAGETMHPAIRPFIHHADVYACDPAALAARFGATPTKGDRFFFTVVKQQNQKTGKEVRYVRVAGPGSWIFQKAEDVMDRGVKVGELRKLRYKYNNSSVASEWLMQEYSCACSGVVPTDDALVVVDGNKLERVFCRVYVSPNGRAAKSAASSSSSFQPQRQEAAEPRRKRLRVTAPPPPSTTPSASGYCTTTPAYLPSTWEPGLPPIHQMTQPLMMLPPGGSPAPGTPRPSTHSGKLVQITWPCPSQEPAPSTYQLPSVTWPSQEPAPSTSHQLPSVTWPSQEPAPSTSQLPSVPAAPLLLQQTTPEEDPAARLPEDDPAEPQQYDSNNDVTVDEILRFLNTSNDLLDIESYEELKDLQ